MAQPLSTSLMACLLLLSVGVNSHTLMQNPIPFPSQLRDNGPVANDGSDWPCKGEVDYDWSGVANIWERGSKQHLRAMGGASHGGGSCQISVTRDLKPTRKSQWRVIHSIEGGCPIRNLTEVNYGDSPTVVLPSLYNFTVPDWLPVGPAVMAWTWYGRWSVPEMFMNCAPIVVLGQETNADVTEQERAAKFDQAPLVFEANNGNGCWTQNKGSCVKFPNPGESLVVNEECPLYEETMFTGKCGPERSLGNLWSWPSQWTMFSGGAIAVFLVLGVMRVVRTWRGRQKYGHRKLVTDDV
ncbi:endoglucanase [Colletotrichum limetticola]|uniref:Endoglucanase n=1 Tax=Colletotrichum limetticola TaxID=1209924 RepID=A0ABQ9PL46_9PEZI|nr:endoglucanase [Colletotrichum limetticola]